MVLQPNTDLFMEREPHFQDLHNQTREAFNFEEKVQLRNYYSLSLFYLNLKYFPYIPFIADAFSKSKSAMLQTSVFYVNTTWFSFSQKKAICSARNHKCYVPWFCC